MPFSRDDRPARMWRNGRPIVNEFQPTEGLYYRFSPYHVECDKSKNIFPPLIPLIFPGASVNRGQFSRPVDVLIPDPGSPKEFHNDCQVGTFQCGSVPTDIEFKLEGLPAVITLRVEHDPQEHNYSHTEVRAYFDGVYDSERDITRPQRSKLRVALWRAFGCGELLEVVPDAQVQDPADDGTTV